MLEIVRIGAPHGRLVGRFRAVGRTDSAEACEALKDAGVPILGTTPEAIDLAEDRGEFARVLEEGGLIFAEEWYRIYLRGRQTRC